MSYAENAQSLWDRYKQRRDEKARESLIMAYAPLVRTVAGRMTIHLPPSVDLDDLEALGIFGLLDAMEKYDPHRNIKFETYAVSRIRGAIIDGLRAMDWAPRALRQKAKRVEEAYEQVEQRLGRSARDEEVAEALGMTPDELQKTLLELGAAAFLSLDEILPTGEREPVTLGELITDQSTQDPLAELELREKKRILGEAVDSLPEKEKLVVTLFYYEGLTTKEIARVLGVSDSRVSQLHTKAIFRLRGKLSRQKKNLV